MSIHICIGTNRRYLVRTRAPFGRRYLLHGEPCKNELQAIRRLAKIMGTTHATQGNVAMVADYYEPYIVLEMKKP